MTGADSPLFHPIAKDIHKLFKYAICQVFMREQDGCVTGKISVVLSLTGMSAVYIR